MSELSNDQIVAVSPLEYAKTHPDRRWWHIETCPSFKVNPQDCWERTIKPSDTKIDFIGNKEILPHVAAVFMVPIYYKEWSQGNIQAQLFEMLTRDYSHNEGNVEIVYLLNELGRDRVDVDDEYSQFIKQFPTIPNPDKTSEYDWMPATVPDFSNMTIEQFQRYKEISEGIRVNYPEYLSIEHRNQETIEYIKSENEHIINLFKDIARAQVLGKADVSHPDYYQKAQNEIFQLLEIYQDNPECMEIIRLSYANANHVSINLLNLLNTDFIAEGYNRKGIASVRTLGMDYTRIRYGNNPSIIAEPLDVDCVPSANYVKQMRAFYAETKLHCTQVPRVGFLIPGLNRQLTLTGLNAAIKDTQIRDFPPMVTREQSLTLGLIKELNGVSGEPVGSMNRDEDEYLGRRMERFSALAGGVNYRNIQELPPVAHCMIDRPGWVDGASRGNETQDDSMPGNLIYEELLNPELRVFLDIQKFIKWLENKQHLSGKEYINPPYPPSFELIHDKFKEYLSAFFNDIYLPQNQRNRDLFKLLSSFKKNNVFQTTTTSVDIQDWNAVPEEDRFDVAHFINHHSSLILEMKDEDWQYIESLLSDDGGIYLQPKNKFQYALKEYIGISQTPDEFIEISDQIDKVSYFTENNNRSCAYVAGAIKLAYELCIQNYFRTKTDRATTTNLAPQCFDSFENRSSGLKHALDMY